MLTLSTLLDVIQCEGCMCVFEGEIMTEFIWYISNSLLNVWEYFVELCYHYNYILQSSLIIMNGKSNYAESFSDK